MVMGDKMPMGEEAPPKPSPSRHTIESLRLDVESARVGKVWLLLPEGFRAEDFGKTYPLPSYRQELSLLASIPIPPRQTNAGAQYLRRATEAYKRKQATCNSALNDAGRREQEIKQAQAKLTFDIKALKQEAKAAVEGVRQEAREAIASLNDLFALGRRGIAGQMRAHLDSQPWQGEPITAQAFRQCFRMVAQAVKGFGLPSEQKDSAREAIMEEAAASILATQDAIALAPGSATEETEH
jgi:hypothetical protein